MQLTANQLRLSTAMQQAIDETNTIRVQRARVLLRQAAREAHTEQARQEYEAGLHRLRSYPEATIIVLRATFLTLKAVRSELRKYGVVIRKQDDEYRVNVARGTESTAYYTNDLDDALGTGIKMGTFVTPPPTP